MAYVSCGEYFWYYSYSRNPMGREFVDPSGTLIAVNLLILIPLSFPSDVTSLSRQRQIVRKSFC